MIGDNQEANYAYATDLLKRVSQGCVAGIADARIQQVPLNYPQLNVDVDRTLADEVGLTQRDAANSLLVTLSGSGQVRPNFWLNTSRTASPYPITRRPVAAIPRSTPCRPRKLVPITSANMKTPAISRRVGADHPGAGARVSSPIITSSRWSTFYAAVQGRDLGGVAGDIESSSCRRRPRICRAGLT